MKSKPVLTRAILLLLCVLISYVEAHGQLPPTLHRVTDYDTAVDPRVDLDKQGQEDFLYPTSGLAPGGITSEKPVRNITLKKVDRADYDRRAKELGLTLRAEDFRAGVFENWGEQYVELSRQLTGDAVLPRGAGDQVADKNALVFPEEERYPVDVVLRRTRVLVESLESEGELTSEQKRWANELTQLASANRDQNTNADTDYFLACGIRRHLLFSMPILEDVDRILFLARGCYAGCRLTNDRNTDRMGGHFATQVFGFNTIEGGGIFTLSQWRDRDPQVTDMIRGRKVVSGPGNRLVGRELNYGSFMAPELSYDGKTIYFSHCGSGEHRWMWTPDTTWNIFKMAVEGDTIEQLTDGPYNDFDVCELPSGRLVFCSERRGGFIRCFDEKSALRVTTSVLHSMKNDGSDIYPISFYETSEWQPSVDHHGMLVYTRWDYTDRENCLGSSFWTCFPDGRNPRSPHGNYPEPWHTFEDNKHGDHRFGHCPDAESALPMTEMQIRAIPNSHQYVFTAAPHHGETFGSLCLLDLRERDDHKMSQIRRLTPYVPFPESEAPDRGQYEYGAPWPLSDSVFLCNDWENLVLLDRYGNKELICEREILPIGYVPAVRLSEPIPLRERERPPVIPQATSQGEDFVNQSQESTIGVVNVNLSDQPLPADRPARRLRVLQVIPKPDPWMNRPDIGYAPENTPRIALGTVPIDADGSAYFKAPHGKQFIFQILDEKNMAIQTMRSTAFAHPGEKLICVGCHEPVDESVRNAETLPSAFLREPSDLEPECGPVEPVNFYRLVQPLLSKCIECHQDKGITPFTQEYESLRPYVYYFSGGMRGKTVNCGPHGGSRSRPGRVGASESKLGTILFDENHLTSVSDEDRHRIILWLDANAPRLGAFRDEERQKQGELVWPVLDTERCNEYEATTPEATTP
ncbi:MAG: hypothetical protein Q4G68_13370 [Planctomycetia bacterium]|nr:hypothetical protein [Planctomycetia bacterium]